MFAFDNFPFSLKYFFSSTFNRFINWLKSSTLLYKKSRSDNFDWSQSIRLLTVNNVWCDDLSLFI